jgi:hypothetical protein
VVVGYHGAGLANALFSPPNTVVVEYTTFLDINETQLWRTNQKIAQLHGKLLWLKHTIDIDRLTSLSKLANTTNPDHYIKDLTSVEVPGSALFNSIERVKEVLALSSVVSELET